MLYGRWMSGLDIAARFGLSGILGLGTVGLGTLFIGLLPGGLSWGIAVVWLAALAGAFTLYKNRFWSEKLITRKPRGAEWGVIALLAVSLFTAVVAALAPSTSLDWDTIAYHLAVPKLWLAAGHIYPIPFIHHSNFPQSVDNLYIWGLAWGGQTGAKTFQICFYLLGLITVFGFARARYGAKAAGWAALAFGTVPVVLWEAGTGYIDVAHGLYAAVGVLLLADIIEDLSKGADSPTKPWPIAALCLGFAAGSKYTGLQVFIAVGVVFGAYALLKNKGKGVKTLAATLGLACVVCSPWYIKNELWAGNPVYPFFYEQFGGKNWSQFNADIYKNQQQTFGIPRKGPAGGIGVFPDAVLGLAFQPGRYTDPSPTLVVPEKGTPTGAFGFAWQSTGGAILVAGIIWMLSGRIRRYEGLLLSWIGFSFLMWFVLSQQSRYAITFAPVLAILLGAGVVRLRAGPLLAVCAAFQALGTLIVLVTAQSLDQLNVVTGQVSEAQYLSHSLPYDAYGWLNANVKGGKVALYDEVFGFYLNVPYFWANPGHTTLIGYDQLNDGAQFIARLKEMGFTHIYMSTGYGSYTPQEAEALRALVGLEGDPAPVDDATVSALVGHPEHVSDLAKDPEQKYKWLVADAADRGLFSQKIRFRGGFVLQIR
jgi:4-amino-4-deoxy-L-arabinose transferase-like glycosyltransferase